MSFGNGRNTCELHLENSILKISNQERDLGILVTSSLKWTAHVKLSCQKANSVLFMVKRNISRATCRDSRLNLYKSLVISVMVYGSPVWYPSKTYLKMVEGVQHRATRWIFSYDDIPYINRLQELNLLPLSIYLELLDLLTLSKVIHRQVDIELPPCLSFSETRRNRKIFILPKVRLERSRTNFWYRSARLANILPQEVDFLNPVGLKGRLLRYFWRYFDMSFRENVPCTWRVSCLCQTCRQTTF
jgi:hypothetical protein